MRGINAPEAGLAGMSLNGEGETHKSMLQVSFALLASFAVNNKSLFGYGQPFAIPLSVDSIAEHGMINGFSRH
jgi:hypothetical protein